MKVQMLSPALQIQITLMSTHVTYSSTRFFILLLSHYFFLLSLAQFLNGSILHQGASLFYVLSLSDDIQGFTDIFIPDPSMSSRILSFYISVLQHSPRKQKQKNACKILTKKPTYISLKAAPNPLIFVNSNIIHQLFKPNGVIHYSFFPYLLQHGRGCTP